MASSGWAPPSPMSAADEDLIVKGYRIPADDLAWSFGPSGGPGGQHANRSNTRSELRYGLADSTVFPDSLRSRMLAQLDHHLHNGVVTVVVDESRSQWRNRSIARRRLIELLEQAMKVPTPRRRTRPTKASRVERVADKRARSEIKKGRRRPEID
jgi:ribosome-associated protein